MANWTEHHDLVYAFVCVSFLADGVPPKTTEEVVEPDALRPVRAVFKSAASVQLEPLYCSLIPTKPVGVIRILSVGEFAPSAVVFNTRAPGVSSVPGVPSISACIVAT